MSRSVRRDTVWFIEYIVIIVLVLKVYLTESLEWNKVRCSADPQQTLPEGYLPDIGRFPWLGVIQHTLNIGGVQRFVITSSILVHPAYAIAAADDISQIPYETLTNSTKLILWNSKEIQYAISIQNYVLHPEYEEKVTLASMALVQLLTYGETGVGDNQRPVLPVCLPTMGAGSYTDMYAVKMTDERKTLEKEALKMNYVEEKDCLTFYEKNELSYNLTSPVTPTCAVAAREMPPCVWDAGVALITRQSWGHWTLLGFSVRGAGCGAPARFLNIFDYMPWINDLVTPITEEQARLHRIGVRRLSPYKLILYKADTNIRPGTGLCQRHLRGNVLYKDSYEITSGLNFAQGFYFLEVTQIAQFTCAEVTVMRCTAKSNTAVWIEHNCHREMSGSAPGHGKRYNYNRQLCFLYYQSTLFLEFRFHFSFRAVMDIVVFGKPESKRFIPDPFDRTITTDSWWPTNYYIKWGSFFPHIGLWMFWTDM